MRWRLCCGRFAGRAHAAVAFLGDHFNKNLCGAFGCGRVHARDDLGQMHWFGAFFSAAELAVKVPEVHPGRQRHAALAFDVLANLVFDGVQHAVRVFAFDLKFERFSHGRP